MVHLIGESIDKSVGKNGKRRIDNSMNSKGSNPELRILGVDPAARCGWSHSCGEYGVWDLKASGDKHPGRRLERFRRFLFTTKRKVGIDLIAAEDAAFGSRIRSVQALHDELRGVIKLCAAEWEIPIALYKPTEIKKWLTDNGRASKSQMINAIATIFNIRTSDDNEADAIAIMEMAKANYKGFINGDSSRRNQVGSSC